MTEEPGREARRGNLKQISVKDLLGKRVLDVNVEEFGKVDDIYLNLNLGTVTGIVVRTGSWFRRRRYQIQATEIERVGDRVILRVDRATIEAQAEPEIEIEIEIEAEPETETETEVEVDEER
ncbi:MAG: PRC-barrel domain-containing protein [Candidatus Bipolaricaulia bacterium]